MLPINKNTHNQPSTGYCLGKSYKHFLQIFMFYFFMLLNSLPASDILCHLLINLFKQSVPHMPDLDTNCLALRWYSKTCLKRPLSKRPKHGFQDQLSHNAGQKYKMYCRMLQGEHSAILLTFIKLPVVIKIFVSSTFEWPFYTGFSVFLES